MSYELNKPQRGVIHEFAPNLTAFEFTKSEEYAPNVVIFIGGLTNGLLNVPYLAQLADKVANIDNGSGKWVLVQVLLSSAYMGWGTSSLSQDTDEIDQLVKYLRSAQGGSRKKVVLTGHSTGCQDTIEYITKHSYKPDFDKASAIDGGILQAPVSDGEFFRYYLKNDEYYDSLVKEVYDNYISKGLGEELLPEKFRNIMINCPITAYRFYSLISERGDDDYFSSYLTDKDHEKSFGKVNVPLLVLYGSKDECVPDYVDREALVKSWQDATNPKYWSPLSKVLVGAVHNVGPDSDEGAATDLLETIAKFVENL